MESIEKTFSDKEGNHLLVALCFCDEDYKRDSLHIPEEYAGINIADINITKAYIDKPIHYSVFFKMSSWLLNEFNKRNDIIFTFICSTDELETNHPEIPPQTFRWFLFEKLFQRQANKSDIYIQDAVVGLNGYQSLGRAFYRSEHAPIIHIVAAYLHDKQQQYL